MTTPVVSHMQQCRSTCHHSK